MTDLGIGLLAKGFRVPHHDGLLNEVDIELDESAKVKAAEKSYQANISKIITAEEMRGGRSLLVLTASEGRESPDKADEYLALL